MIEFWHALIHPDLFFLRYAVIIGFLASLSFGIIGTYVVTRRISYIAGAIAHSVLAGIGFGLFARAKWGLLWLQPVHGAIVTALLAALIIGLVSLSQRQREDTIIGAIWAIGMAVGLLFLAKTPGYVDPMSYLFGNILLITTMDLWAVGLLDLVVIGLSIVFHNSLQAICFDEEFARTRGLRVEFFYLLLLCLTALTVVLLVSVVGIVLVIALLTLPPAVAGFFSRKLWQMMVLSVLFCLIFTMTGLVVSYDYDLPSGPVIIVIAGIIYLLVMLGRHTYKRLSMFRA
ncbi:metal ABC transporter permease [bacterium]|nr:metal ABC transporter permease [bacterium]